MDEVDEVDEVYYTITNHEKHGLVRHDPKYDWYRFHFTTADKVYKLLSWRCSGTFIRKVHLPNYPNLNITKQDNGIHRANMFNLGKSYSIFDPVNIEQFKLHENMHELIDRCVSAKNLTTLEFLKTSKYKFRWTVNCVAFMLKQKQHVDAITWFKESGRQVYNDCYMVEKFASDGDVEALEWLAKAAYPRFKYNILAVNYAARNGHLNVLTWFNKSRLEFKYGCGAMNGAAEKGNIEVLEWFLQNKRYNLKCSSSATVAAAKHGQLDVLKWLLKNNLIKRDKRAIGYAKQNGYFDIMEWLELHKINKKLIAT